MKHPDSWSIPRASSGPGEFKRGDGRYCYRLRATDHASEESAMPSGSFMTSDPGYIDLEQRTLAPLDNPFGTRSLPMS